VSYFQKLYDINYPHMGEGGGEFKYTLPYSKFGIYALPCQKVRGETKNNFIGGKNGKMD
jgi:hypothetical protein